MSVKAKERFDGFETLFDSVITFIRNRVLPRWENLKKAPHEDQVMLNSADEFSESQYS